VHGEVRVMPSSDDPERFSVGSSLYARPTTRSNAGARAIGERVLLCITSSRGDVGLPIVAFAGVTDRDEAEALRGHVLEIPSAELAQLEDGEFYYFDLEGLDVRTRSGDVVGTVAEVLESPANVVLVVALTAGGTTLLPFVEEVVPDLDIGGGFVVVDERYLSPDEA
jgi:16S rRNA processing protein RimM